jgi:hypothetical protein
MADGKGLRRIGYIFASVTLAVILTAGTLVKADVEAASRSGYAAMTTLAVAAR